MRNIVGLAEKNPDLAKRGIRLRKFVQEISERITSKKIHAVGIVAGGMSRPLAEDHRQALLAWIPEVQETTRIGLDLIMKYLSDHAAEVKDLDRFETLYLGTVTPDGAHELYDGKLPFVDAEGRVLADQLDPGRRSGSGPSCRRGPRLPRTTLSPATLLALTLRLCGRVPAMMVCTVRGEAFSFGETISPRVTERVNEAVAQAVGAMPGSGTMLKPTGSSRCHKRKTSERRVFDESIRMKQSPLPCN